MSSHGVFDLQRPLARREPDGRWRRLCGGCGAPLWAALWEPMFVELCGNCDDLFGDTSHPVNSA